MNGQYAIQFQIAGHFQGSDGYFLFLKFSIRDLIALSDHLQTCTVQCLTSQIHIGCHGHCQFSCVGPLYIFCNQSATVSNILLSNDQLFRKIIHIYSQIRPPYITVIRIYGQRSSFAHADLSIRCRSGHNCIRICQSQNLFLQIKQNCMSLLPVIQIILTSTHCLVCIYLTSIYTDHIRGIILRLLCDPFFCFCKCIHASLVGFCILSMLIDPVKLRLIFRFCYNCQAACRFIQCKFNISVSHEVVIDILAGRYDLSDQICAKNGDLVTGFVFAVTYFISICINNMALEFHLHIARHFFNCIYWPACLFLRFHSAQI